MTINELYLKLLKSEISEERFYLHGLFGSTDDDNKFALNIRKGKHAIEYEVYYKERGEKHSSRVFSAEDDACQYIFKKLIENKNIEDKYSK